MQEATSKLSGEGEGGGLVSRERFANLRTNVMSHVRHVQRASLF